MGFIIFPCSAISISPSSVEVLFIEYLCVYIGFLFTVNQPIFVKLDPVHELRPSEDVVQDDAGQGGVPHSLGGVPVWVVVITDKNDKMK